MIHMKTLWRKKKDDPKQYASCSTSSSNEISQSASLCITIIVNTDFEISDIE